MRIFRNTCMAFMLAVMFIAFLTGSSYALDKKELIILHTNDMHGQVYPYYFKQMGAYYGGVANLAARINQLREEYGKDKILLIDAGDISQGTPVSNIFQGDPMTDYMNYIGYDCTTFGNHEFDWGQKALLRQVQRRKFPTVCANVIETATGQVPTGVKPYIVVERAGMKIGIIGVATPSTPRMSFHKNVEGLEFLDSVETINKYREELNKQGIKVIGVVSHNGYKEDLDIAKEVKGITFIIGGHSHTPVYNPYMVNGIPVCQAGEWGKFIGFERLKIDADTGKTISFEGKLIHNIAADEKLAKQLAPYKEKVDKSMNEVLGDLSADITHLEYQVKGSGTTSAGDVVTDIMKAVTGADVAFINTHGIRASLPKGTITRGSVFTILPFDNALMTCEVKGSDLAKIIEYYVDRPSFTQVAGIKCDYDSKKPFDHRVTNIKINGKDLDPNKTYKIATIDFLFGASKDCKELQNAKNINTAKVLRDEVEAYIKQKKHIVVPEEIRIKVLNGNSPGERKRH